VGNYVVPKSIDAPPASAGYSVGWATTVDMLLVLMFAVQHSVMARPGFKAVWTRIVPQPIERSTYVLLSNVALGLLIVLWQPIDAVVWQTPSGVATYLAIALFAAGWLLVPAVSFMLNHFDLFGTRQVWLHLRNKPYTSLRFATPGLYGVVRHPLYIGWAMAFWCTPTMTVGHLLLAASLTIYMALASRVEERDLVSHFGAEYEDYRRRVPAFVPWPIGSEPKSTAALPNDCRRPM
jgi:protein-S-isoprenylcysteine O-methyltransferase Ste14